MKSEKNYFFFEFFRNLFESCIVSNISMILLEFATPCTTMTSKQVPNLWSGALQMRRNPKNYVKLDRFSIIDVNSEFLPED